MTRLAAVSNSQQKVNDENLVKDNPELQLAFGLNVFRYLTNIMSTMDRQEIAFYHLPVLKHDEYTVDSLITTMFKTAGIKEIDMYRGVRAFRVGSHTVVISMLPAGELDRSKQWRTLYLPYSLKYGNAINLRIPKSATHTSAASEIKPYIMTHDNEPIEIPQYKKVAIYNGNGDIIDYMKVDTAAAELIERDRLRFILNGSKPYCSKVKQYAVQILFEKDDDEDFINVVDDDYDLRFRSIGTGHKGVKLMRSIDSKKEAASVAHPVYWNEIDHFHEEVERGFRPPHEDLDDWAYVKYNMKRYE